jgi:hypothetical protein
MACEGEINKYEYEQRRVREMQMMNHRRCEWDGNGRVWEWGKIWLPHNRVNPRNEWKKKV